MGQPAETNSEPVSSSTVFSFDTNGPPEPVGYYDGWTEAPGSTEPEWKSNMSKSTREAMEDAMRPSSRVTDLGWPPVRTSQPAEETRSPPAGRRNREFMSSWDREFMNGI